MSEDKFQRLSEGYDFIEEALGYSMPLDFQEVSETSIVESERTGSSFRVIGKACGPFQPMGEMSRNNRLYENDHWDMQLENLQFQDRIKARDLLGTIGHHDKKVDDADIAAGIVSHIVTCLEKREDSNGVPYLYGELEILDTPAGRNLKALYEGGANLYVSSRGAGKLLPVPNESYKLVDKNNYFCETFDVVRRPGFLKAKPMFEEVQESVSEGCSTVDSELNKKAEEIKANDKAPSAKEELKKFVKKEDKEVNEEVEALKGQIDRLAQVLEKVVDDMYEVPTEEVTEEREVDKSALLAAIALMNEANLSEETFCGIVDTIKEALDMAGQKSVRRNADKMIKNHEYNAKELQKKADKAFDQGKENKADRLSDKAEREFDKATSQEERRDKAQSEVDKLRK